MNIFIVLRRQNDFINSITFSIYIGTMDGLVIPPTIVSSLSTYKDLIGRMSQFHITSRSRDIDINTYVNQIIEEYFDLHKSNACPEYRFIVVINHEFFGYKKLYLLISGIDIEKDNNSNIFGILSLAGHICEHYICVGQIHSLGYQLKII
jgi:hypothetical protein